jgi:NADPH-dependent glutamate synthase beta subunit-like oxidoreductase
MTERLPPRERTKIPRQTMPEQDAHERAGNFAEVNLGFDAALAQKESLRCLSCADPKCVHGCPVGVKVREVVDLVRQGEYLQAAAKLREDNVLSAITGRVCPQENQCEGSCILAKRFAPLAIGHIERFVADYERRTGQVGRTITVDELFGEEKYHAVFIATGAGLPQFMNIAGEHLGGIYSANEFLTRVNLMKAYDPGHYDSPVFDCRGRRAVVVGGGNTAMDSVRCAIRLGADEAYVIYRRSEAEMPARREELEHAKQEGVRLLTLSAPVEFVGNDAGYLTGVKLQRMELGEPDGSGRRRPLPVAGSEWLLPIDMAVIAIGTGANSMVQSTTPDLATNRWGYIVADEQILRTSKAGVFAGGDIVSGSATVILAMGMGRKAARSIHEYLTTGQW